MKKYLEDIIRRKDLLIYLVVSGLKSKHRNTWLGYFWWVLDPLLNVLVYYFLIGIVLGRGDIKNFPVFLVIGLMVFRWFRSNLTSTAKAISSKSGIIKQVYLPKAIFPIAESIAQLINFLFGLVVITLFLIYYRVVPGVQIIWLPFVIFIQLLLHLAIGLVMGYFCVFVRDIEHILGHFMRILRYASPVIWEAGRLPQEYQWLVKGNPFSHILISYRNVIMYRDLPNFYELIWIGIVSLIIIIFMLYFYSRNEHKIIKVL